MPSALEYLHGLARWERPQGKDRNARFSNPIMTLWRSAAPAANVQRFLKEIRGRGRWSFRLGAALAPDSNIGGTSDERTI